MLEVLFKNNQLLVVNKPPGKPVQDDPSGEPSLHAQAEAYCRHPLHLVHRLDRPVSGLVLFAKSARAMKTMTAQFQNRTVNKQYLAIVLQEPPAESGQLVHYLQKNARQNRVELATEPGEGLERCELTYRVVDKSDRYTLLLVEPLTGRHHQIRAQLAALGCPVRGDVKYGFKRANPDKSIGLHAWRLAFDHPVSGQRIELEAPVPDDVLWKSFNFSGTT